MIHLLRDPEAGQYGLRQQRRPNGTYGHWAHIEDTVKPKVDPVVDKQGTKVVLLGYEGSANTMQAPAGAPSPSRWVGRYSNTRYFRFPDGITVRAREGWENPRADKDRNVLRTLWGRERPIQPRRFLGPGPANQRYRALVDPQGRASACQNAGFVMSSGHPAALYRDELYEMMARPPGPAGCNSSA